MYAEFLLCLVSTVKTHFTTPTGVFCMQGSTLSRRKPRTSYTCRIPTLSGIKTRTSVKSFSQHPLVCLLCSFLVLSGIKFRTTAKLFLQHPQVCLLYTVSTLSGIRTRTSVLIIPTTPTGVFSMHDFYSVRQKPRTSIEFFLQHPPVCLLCCE